MEAIARSPQTAKPMIVFTVLLLEDVHSETSSNYGAIARSATEGFHRGNIVKGLALGGKTFEAQAKLRESYTPICAGNYRKRCIPQPGKQMESTGDAAWKGGTAGKILTPSRGPSCSD